MANVLTHMCMSLDGFVAQPDDNPAELFEWYWAGEVVVPSAQETMNTREVARRARVFHGDSVAELNRQLTADFVETQIELQHVYPRFAENAELARQDVT